MKTFKIVETFKKNNGTDVDVRIGTMTEQPDGTMVAAFDILPRSLTVNVKLVQLT